ncbi:hypothetical protein [Xylella fastidiosa]|uniref:hypothetical protein n=1 Tax=Xylella fastidiosa TaxID=2371 RepID=UPI001FB95F4B|nr:hypothetical protein [Xylella fastidiosa]
MPACLLTLSEIEPAPENDAGTGQFPALLRFQARLVLGHRGPPPTCKHVWPPPPWDLAVTSAAGVAYQPTPAA